MKSDSHQELTLLAVAVAVAASSCGGGGGGDSADASASAIAYAPAPPAVSGGLAVTESLIPAGSAGIANTPTYGDSPTASRDGTGSFRTACEFSHMNFDDPLVFPGQRGASHLHAFFGNTSVDGMTSPDLIRASGNSTCRGGTFNRSAYWVPAIVDTRNGRPIAPAVSDGSGLPESTFYYKTGYHIPLSDYPKIVMPPVGFRMIAGDSKASTPQGGMVQWFCDRGTASTPNNASIPRCAAGDILNARLVFPSCWDGVNVDSPNHKDHVTYPPDSGSCPGSHPVPIPEITYNIYYEVQSRDDLSAWRLSSDRYVSGPGGYSMHGDWVNGWDPDVSALWIRNCLNSPKECGSGALGDGRHLSYVWPLLAPRQVR